VTTVTRKRKFGGSLIPGIALICAAGAAVVVAQRPPALVPPTARDASALSSVFRDVARHALPAIVTIESRRNPTPTVNRRNPNQNPFRNSPFQNDPRLREFFRQFEGFEEFDIPERPKPDSPGRLGEGSGFVINRNGYIMTNNHVVMDAEEVVVTLHDGRRFKAGKDAIATDERSDVAVIRIDNPPPDLTALRFGDSDQMQIGDWVLAIGAPFGYELTVTQGIISAKGRGVRGLPKEFLQTDAAINPGNSGGPLLNLRGEVIGINTAISSRSGGYEGIGFAVPSRTARWASDQLVRNGVVKRAGLGVEIDDLDYEHAQQMKLDRPHGVVVRKVFPGTPAAAAKLEVEDVIVAIDGDQIRNRNQLQAQVEQLEFGHTYKLTVYRDGTRRTVPVLMTEVDFDALARSEEANRDSRLPIEPNGEATGDAIGVMVRKTDAATARRLKLDPGTGVTVTSVQRGSLAHAVGIRPGYVIRKVGSTVVNSVDEYRAALKKESLAAGITLVIENESGSQLVRIQRN